MASTLSCSFSPSFQAKASGKKLQKVTLTVSPRGIILYDSASKQLIENISIYRSVLLSQHGPVTCVIQYFHPKLVLIIDNKTKVVICSHPSLGGRECKSRCGSLRQRNVFVNVCEERTQSLSSMSHQSQLSGEHYNSCTSDPDTHTLTHILSSKCLQISLACHSLHA